MKSIIVLHLVFSVSWQHKYQHWRVIYPWFIVNKHRVTGNWFEYFHCWIKSQHFYYCSSVLAYSFRSWLQSTLPSIQFWPSLDIAKPRQLKDLFVNRINIVVPITCMQQKHVITHPDQAGRTRSRQNQNYPEKYFCVTILFSYELQLLCVWYYRSPPEIVYLKCYCEFIFFFKLLIIYFTFYFIFVYFSNFRGSKNRGPWTRSIFWWTRSMDPVRGGGPWTRGPRFVLSLQASYRPVELSRTTLHLWQDWMTCKGFLAFEKDYWIPDLGV